MKPNIHSLKSMKFTKMTPERDEIIEKETAELVPAADSYLPNKLAKALHPEVQHVKVEKVTERAPDTKSYELVPDKAAGTDALAYFSAGQYVTVSLTVGEAEITRPYSLSSSPKESLDGKYEITVKRAEGGLASEYILDHFTEGTAVDLSAPLGTFTYEPLRDAKQIVGLAGGSGITPFMSLAKAIADGDEDCSLTLLYGSRTLEDSIFADEFAAIEKSCPKFKLVWVLSDSEAEGCEKGFITADLIKKYAPEGEYSVFLCGPQAMYRFADKEIKSLGLRRKFIRHELFGEYRNPEQDEAYPGAEKEQFDVTVVVCGEKQVIKANANDTLLTSMEKAGIKVPAHCRSGQCGWCHSRLISGNVYIPESMDYLRMADKKYGYIHPCCAFPVSDIEIEVPVRK